MTELNMSGINVFPPQDLDYYREMTRDLSCTVNLSRDECAVVLKPMIAV